jgi:hypothetical protein
MEIGAILGLNDLKAKGAADARLPLAAIRRSGFAVDRGCARRRRTTTAARPLLGLASRRGGD